jgi:hypothetical protein
VTTATATATVIVNRPGLTWNAIVVSAQTTVASATQAIGSYEYAGLIVGGAFVALVRTAHLAANPELQAAIDAVAAELSATVASLRAAADAAATRLALAAVAGSQRYELFGFPEWALLESGAAWDAFRAQAPGYWLGEQSDGWYMQTPGRDDRWLNLAQLCGCAEDAEDRPALWALDAQRAMERREKIAAQVETTDRPEWGKAA